MVTHRSDFDSSMSHCDELLTSLLPARGYTNKLTIAGLSPEAFAVIFALLILERIASTKKTIYLLERMYVQFK